MDTLTKLTKLLTNNDKKQFKQFLQHKNKRKDVKNLELLNFIETDDINGLNNTYKTQKNKDAYHALRKRLQESLLLFLSQKTFERSSETYDALRLLVVGRFLIENDVIAIAYKCLEKAERLAVQLEQFNLINELLLLKLQYAHLPGSEDLEILTDRFLQNQALMQREAKLNMAYAFLRKELNEVHQKGKVINLTALMLTTIRKYKIAGKDLLSYKSIYQILFLANEYAAIQQNYGLIERYVDRTKKFMANQPGNAQSYLFYHISILYFLANFHFRQLEFAKSTSLLQEMETLMETDTRYYSLFTLRYKLLSALNLFYTGFAADAINLIKQTLSTTTRSAKPEEIEDLNICLIMFLALKNDRSSLKQLAQLARTDAWYEKKLGMLWTIRKALMEILVQGQFSNIDTTTSKINGFKRRYRKYLLKISEERVSIFLKLVEKYLKKPDIAFEKAYQNDVMKLLDGGKNNDVFTLSFIAWLIARWKKSTAYEVVIELINDTYAPNEIAPLL
ncbi:hypothetical protein FPZ43_15320 [Mucilaginibacter pallidiroseus]|uniref:Uncharacterized protein n=1 Tax=Mucilaginibacter pallidiroseus TaxID=2599295 RepID=A0A563U5E3_9SPHI|nr:hypothetical protein [Mucilaginibacter pallidiroseus]TWR26522.1 hypothetical protein FPZ43_15320 [Mucilaginibacter pallidiroseus]